MNKSNGFLLRNALICVNEVEMFSCQAGAEGQDRRHTLKKSPEGIARAEFFFKDGQHVSISPGHHPDPISEAEKCLQQVTQPVPLPKASVIDFLIARRASFPACAHG